MQPGGDWGPNAGGGGWTERGGLPALCIRSGCLHRGRGRLGATGSISGGGQKTVIAGSTQAVCAALCPVTRLLEGSRNHSRGEGVADGDEDAGEALSSGMGATSFEGVAL